jgi:predicted dienelactone hydrolase
MQSILKKLYPMVAIYLISSIALSGCLKPKTPEPLFEKTESFETTMQNGDAADVYYPVVEGLAKSFGKLPMALFLQGGRVDKQYYSQYAQYVARYGFIIVVPNHISSFTVPGYSATGLFSQQSQIYDVMEFLKQENADTNSPLHKMVDTETLVVLGHSYGAACTWEAIQNTCEYSFCPPGQTTFTRPPELKGVIFCGINSKPYGVPGDTTIRPTHNMGMPMAFINGAIETRAVYQDSIISYGMIDDPPKMLVEVKGANHFGMCDIDNPPGPGQDTAVPTIDREVSIETYARWSALFLRAYALHDTEAFIYINKTGQELDTNVEVWSDSGCKF